MCFMVCLPNSQQTTTLSKAMYDTSIANQERKSPIGNTEATIPEPNKYPSSPTGARKLYFPPKITPGHSFQGYDKFKYYNWVF